MLQSPKTPSILFLSRQNLPNLENPTIELATKGGYVLHEEEAEHLTIVSTGSEVSIALEGASKPRAQGIQAYIVSLPWLVFNLWPYVPDSERINWVHVRSDSTRCIA